VYGAWLEADKLVWKPRLEENVLECLGPENCPGLNCEANWDDCIPPGWRDRKNELMRKEKVTLSDFWTDPCDTQWLQTCLEEDKSQEKCEQKCLEEEATHTKGCAKWYTTLMRKDAQYFNATIESLCQATEKPIGERTALDASVATLDKFHLYNITGTKYRYAVDVERRRRYYHDNTGMYKDLEDPELLEKAERSVGEKCHYGGAYYALGHYGISTQDPDESSCEQLRDNSWPELKDETRWLRQEGLDGWFWTMLSLGEHRYGFLRSPLLLPWEIDSCATVPCLGQCIAIESDPSKLECPSSPALWPIRMAGTLITNVVVPLLALRVILYLSGSIISRLRCCPRRCKDTVKQAQAVRRSCWFIFMRGARKLRKAGMCAQCLTITVLVSSFYFFSQ
jgi:hypothetical protein